MAIFTTEEKRELARSYANSGQTQEQFCLANGIGSARTLRGWLTKYPPAHRAERAAYDAIKNVVAVLTELLRSLDADAACRKGEPEPAPLTPDKKFSWDEHE